MHIINHNECFVSLPINHSSFALPGFPLPMNHNLRSMKKINHLVVNGGYGNSYPSPLSMVMGEKKKEHI